MALYPAMSYNHFEIIGKPAETTQVKFFGSLSDFNFEISIVWLSTLIGLPLDIISKGLNILSKPTEPKVSSTGQFKIEFHFVLLFHILNETLQLIEI